MGKKAYRKRGLDRESTAITQAVSEATGTLSTSFPSSNTITNGTVVTIRGEDWTSPPQPSTTNTATEYVGTRKTGAILIHASGPKTSTHVWSVDDGNLTLTIQGDFVGTEEYRFWVF